MTSDHRVAGSSLPGAKQVPAPEDSDLSLYRIASLIGDLWPDLEHVACGAYVPLGICLN